MTWQFWWTLYNVWSIVRRIVRNKAAEKAKHAHQQQQAQQQQGQQQGQPGSGGSVSVIAHAPATAAGHPAATAPNAYSISGILGIPAHHQDPNGNSIKRKRSVDGESFATLRSCCWPCFFVRIFLYLPITLCHRVTLFNTESNAYYRQRDRCSWDIELQLNLQKSRSETAWCDSMRQEEMLLLLQVYKLNSSVFSRCNTWDRIIVRTIVDRMRCSNLHKN